MSTDENETEDQAKYYLDLGLDKLDRLALDGAKASLLGSIAVSLYELRTAALEVKEMLAHPRVAVQPPEEPVVHGPTTEDWVRWLQQNPQFVKPGSTVYQTADELVGRYLQPRPKDAGE